MALVTSGSVDFEVHVAGDLEKRSGPFGRLAKTGEKGMKSGNHGLGHASPRFGKSLRFARREDTTSADTRHCGLTCTQHNC